MLIPQDLDYPALRAGRESRDGGAAGPLFAGGRGQRDHRPDLEPDDRSQLLGRPKTGNDYMLTVQYPDAQIAVHDMMTASRSRCTLAKVTETTTLGAVTDIKTINSPTEVDHYQLRRVIDVYVSPPGRGPRSALSAVDDIIKQTKLPEGVRVTVRGSVEGMRQSFKSFGLGPDPVDRAGLPDPDGAVCLLRRSLDHPAGHTSGHYRRDRVPAGHPHHAERHVADGRHHDDRHRGLQQHSDRGRDPRVTARRGCRSARRWPWPAACACGPS